MAQNRMSTPTPASQSHRRGHAWTAVKGTAAGLLLGLCAAGLFIYSGTSSGETHAHWWGNPNIGSPGSDIWTRARIALGGLLALRRDETVYFDRTEDDEGRRLEARCSYRLSGTALPARWWSVTIYTDIGFLPRNGGGPHSVDATRVGGGKQPWHTIVSGDASDATGGAPWINSRESGRFHLTLRLYHPQPDAAADFSTLPYPRVTRIGCGDGS